MKNQDFFSISASFFGNPLLKGKNGAESVEWAVIICLLILMAVIMFSCGSGNCGVHAAIVSFAGNIAAAINGLSLGVGY